MSISLAQIPGQEPRSSKLYTISIQKFSSSLQLLPKYVHSTGTLGPRRLVQYRPCTTPLLVSVPISHGSLQTGITHWIPFWSSSRFKAASRSVSPAHCLLFASAFPPSLIPFFIRFITVWLLQVSALIHSFPIISLHDNQSPNQHHQSGAR